jgi:hypothetical protein
MRASPANEPEMNEAVRAGSVAMRHNEAMGGSRYRAESADLYPRGIVGSEFYGGREA